MALGFQRAGRYADFSRHCDYSRITGNPEAEFSDFQRPPTTLPRSRLGGDPHLISSKPVSGKPMPKYNGRSFVEFSILRSWGTGKRRYFMTMCARRVHCIRVEI